MDAGGQRPHHIGWAEGCPAQCLVFSRQRTHLVRPFGAKGANVELVTQQPPPPAHDMVEEPRLPARDVTLMTLAAYALIVLASFTEFAQ